MPLLKTICAKPMWWLGALHFWLRNVGEGSMVYGLQYIALFLCIPVFKLHNLLFKVTYLLNQRELVSLGRHCAILGGNDFSLEFDNLKLHFGTDFELEQTARDVRRRLETSARRLNCY